MDDTDEMPATHIGWPILRRVILVIVVPVVTIAGLASLYIYDPGYPASIVVGLALFGVLWFWFRALGRVLF